MKNNTKSRYTTYLFLSINIVNLAFTIFQYTRSSSERPILFGLSLERMILIFFVFFVFFVTSLVVLQLGLKKGRIFTKFNEIIIKPERLKQFLFYLLLLCYGFFLVSVIPSYRLGKWQGYWELLSQIFVFLCITFIVLFLASLSGFSTLLKRTHTRSHYSFPLNKRDMFVLALAGLIVIGILFIFKNTSIVDKYYWNVAGVPILPELAYLIFGITLFLPLYFNIFKKSTLILSNNFFIAAFLFILCNLLFQPQDITRNFFVEIRNLFPAEYFPNSDALIYDFSAIAFLNGLGINALYLSDKPFYTVYVALLHFIMGDNYQDIVRLNVLVLSFIPVMIFLIGKKLDTNGSGILLAFASMFFELTTFQSSGYISNIHWKLIMPEPLAQLLILISVYCLLQIFSEPFQDKWLILAGIFLGIGTYIRPQIIILTAGILLLIFLKNQLFFIQRIKVFVKVFLSYFFVTMPWAIYCFLRFGGFPIIGKFQWIQNYRFTLTAFNLSNTHLLGIGAGTVMSMIPNDKLLIIIAHFLNNIIKALLILPYSLRMDKVPQIFNGIEYWNETIVWNGQISPIFFLSLFIFMVGIIGSYKHKKNISLIPLFCMMIYFLALAVSRTSGSRYLVPVIWVVYLYYLLGIIYIARYIANLFFMISPAEQRQMIITTPTIFHQKHTRVIYLLPIMLGLSIPLLDFAIPINQHLILEENQLQEKLSQPEIFELLNIDSSDWQTTLSQQKVKIGYGEMLYSQYSSGNDQSSQGKLSFSLLGNYPMINLVFPISEEDQQNFVETNKDNLYFVLGCKPENSLVDIPFYMQSSDNHVFISSENRMICLDYWNIDQ